MANVYAVCCRVGRLYADDHVLNFNLIQIYFRVFRWDSLVFILCKNFVLKNSFVVAAASSARYRTTHANIQPSSSLYSLVPAHAKATHIITRNFVHCIHVSHGEAYKYTGKVVLTITFAFTIIFDV